MRTKLILHYVWVKYDKEKEKWTANIDFDLEVPDAGIRLERLSAEIVQDPVKGKQAELVFPANGQVTSLKEPLRQYLMATFFCADNKINIFNQVFMRGINNIILRGATHEFDLQR